MNSPQICNTYSVAKLNLKFEVWIFYKRGKLTRPVEVVVNEGGWSHHRNNLQTGYNQYGSRCTWAYMTLSLNWRLKPFFFPICSLFHYCISTHVKREIIRYWSKHIMRLFNQNYYKLWSLWAYLPSIKGV